MDALLGSAPITGQIYIDPGCGICTDHLFIGVESTTLTSGSSTPEPATFIPLALGFSFVGLLKHRLIWGTFGLKT